MCSSSSGRIMNDLCNALLHVHVASFRSPLKSFNCIVRCCDMYMYSVVLYIPLRWNSDNRVPYRGSISLEVNFANFVFSFHSQN